MADIRAECGVEKKGLLSLVKALDLGVRLFCSIVAVLCKI